MSVTRRIQKELNEEFIWQRNYHDHIIRSNLELRRIQHYIESNIINWDRSPGEIVDDLYHQGNT